MGTPQRVHILAHRGLWKTASEHNRLEAFRHALESGYGIEVDVRDASGELIVAHDAGEETAYPFEDLCALLLPVADKRSGH
jgi:glycerophosphoryl diester phosphodiesterase